MRLISLREPGTSARAARLGVVAGDRALPASDLGDGVPGMMDELLADTTRGLSLLAAAWDDERIRHHGRRLDDLALASPIPRPGKVVAIGRNYPEHAAEGGANTPAEPLIFAKFTTAVIGHGEEIRWDPALTQQVDWEAELAVVIGRTARRVAEADAFDYVLGYTALNDVSARELQFGDKQWTRGKSLDTFCPIGPMLVTLDELDDPNDLAISCEVNGEVVQSGRTSEMFHDVARIISHCSEAFTLEPGDVIATGTPAGVGVFRKPPRFLTDGDVVTVTIEGIGSLVNVCRFDGAGAGPR